MQNYNFRFKVFDMSDNFLLFLLLFVFLSLIYLAEMLLLSDDFAVCVTLRNFLLICE